MFSVCQYLHISPMHLYEPSPSFPNRSTTPSYATYSQDHHLSSTYRGGGGENAKVNLTVVVHPYMNSEIPGLALGYIFWLLNCLLELNQVIPRTKYLKVLLLWEGAK